MKENVLEYKGYLAKIEFSATDMVLHGKIEGIKDLVTFESDSPKDIEKEFRAAVDDYLEMCQDLGEEPDKAYSGTFNVRINPVLHRKVAMLAIKNDESLNGMVEKIISDYIDNTTQKRVDEIYNILSEGQIYNGKSTRFALANMNNWKQGSIIGGVGHVQVR